MRYLRPGIYEPCFLILLSHCSCRSCSVVFLRPLCCMRSRESLCCRKNSSDTPKSTIRGRCGCEKATIDSLFVANRVFLVYKTPGHTNVPKLKTAVCRCLGELTCPESLICAFSLLICDNMSFVGARRSLCAFDSWTACVCPLCFFDCLI